MSRIKIELEKVLKERKISKNQLCYACKLQHTQLNNYCKNKVVRVDLATIAKICDYVGCSIADILVLEKDEEPEQEKIVSLYSISRKDTIWQIKNRRKIWQMSEVRIRNRKMPQ